MELKRNHCQRYITNRHGEPISVADKMKYPTMEKAQLAADEQNLLLSRKEKVVPYHCTVCDKYHVGRNGEGLTQNDVDEIWERTRPVEYRVPEVKVIGKIDISTIQTKIKKTISKDKVKSLEGWQKTIDNSYDKGVDEEDLISEMHKVWSVIDGRRRAAWIFSTLASEDVFELVEKHPEIGILKMYPELKGISALRRIKSLGKIENAKMHVAGEIIVYRKGYEKQAEAIRDMLIKKGGSWKCETPEEDIAFFRLLGYSKGAIRNHILYNYPEFDIDEYRSKNERRDYLKSINGPNEEIEKLRNKYEKELEENGDEQPA